jgi:hypothetical protein
VGRSDVKPATNRLSYAMALTPGLTGQTDFSFYRIFLFCFMSQGVNKRIFYDIVPEYVRDRVVNVHCHKEVSDKIGSWTGIFYSLNVFVINFSKLYILNFPDDGRI